MGMEAKFNDRGELTSRMKDGLLFTDADELSLIQLYNILKMFRNLPPGSSIAFDVSGFEVRADKTAQGFNFKARLEEQEGWFQIGAQRYAINDYNNASRYLHAVIHGETSLGRMTRGQQFAGENFGWESNPVMSGERGTPTKSKGRREPAGGGGKWYVWEEFYSAEEANEYALNMLRNMDPKMLYFIDEISPDDVYLIVSFSSWRFANQARAKTMQLTGNDEYNASALRRSIVDQMKDRKHYTSVIRREEIPSNPSQISPTSEQGFRNAILQNEERKKEGEKMTPAQISDWDDALAGEAIG